MADLREIVKGGQGVDPLGRFQRSGAGGAARVRASLGGWIWLECRMLDKLNSYRRAGESYSDVILRLASEGG